MSALQPPPATARRWGSQGRRIYLELCLSLQLFHHWGYWGSCHITAEASTDPSVNLELHFHLKNKAPVHLNSSNFGNSSSLTWCNATHQAGCGRNRGARYFDRFLCKTALFISVCQMCFNFCPGRTDPLVLMRWQLCSSLSPRRMSTDQLIQLDNSVAHCHASRITSSC